MAQANAINLYDKKNTAGKVDFICKNYSNFIGIVDSYTEGIRYLIEEEKAMAIRSSFGDLGVRVQKSGTSNPTATIAERNITTREAILTCDFSGGVLDGVENPERYIKDAHVLRQMREHYELFNTQIKSLQQSEQEFFIAYLLKKKKLADWAEEEGICYDSLIQRYNKTKKKLTILMVGFLEGTY